MEKLGFAYEKTAPFMHYGEHVLYRLRAVRHELGEEGDEEDRQPSGAPRPAGR